MPMEFEHPVSIWPRGDPKVIKNHLDLNICSLATSPIILDEKMDKCEPMVPPTERCLSPHDHGPVVAEIDGAAAEDMLAACAVFTQMWRCWRREGSLALKGESVETAPPGPRLLGKTTA